MGLGFEIVAGTGNTDQAFKPSSGG